MKFKDRLLFEVSAALATVVIRIWFGTVRVRILNPHTYDHYLRNPASGNVVAGTWHRNTVFLFYFFRKLAPGPL